MEPTPGDLLKEINYQQGKYDRQHKRPARSANGAYLNGWYEIGTGDYYYITKEYAHMLDLTQAEGA